MHYMKVKQPDATNPVVVARAPPEERGGSGSTSLRERRSRPLCRHHARQGGKPGYVPAFDATPDQLPHWIGLNLWDPFKFTKDLSPEQKEAKLLTEVNNGRLAMIGLMGLLSEAKVPPLPAATHLPRLSPTARRRTQGGESVGRP
jgi:hypothetical protein